MGNTYRFGRFWKKYKRAMGVVLAPFLLFLIADFAFPFVVNPRYSTLVTAADGTTLHAFLNPNDKWRLYTTLPEITPLLRNTFLFKEDKYFYYHAGFNPVAMGRALVRNLTTGRRTSGASTITMQVVRLLQPRARTYTSKIVELLRALQLEWHFSKDEILQLYLNLIPYGSNIEGIKSASLLYFGKPPQLLSLAEITTLTIIPNRPSSLRLGRKNAFVVQERNKWLARFKRSHLFENQTIDDAIGEPLVAFRRPAPALAPHLAIRLKQTFRQQPIIQTTLQMKSQSAVEQLVQNYVNRLRGMNIHNAAVVVVNNQNMAVEVYVGSSDFYNPYDGGQVDGVRAVRSPGSTLKPLIYGLAFDKGLITPKTALSDVPTNFKGFEPENFDRKFNGKVTVEFALANSLNIPAVQVLQTLTPAVLVEKLKQADFKTIQKQASGLELSMALGGCGVTLEELTRLFAAFANNGQLRPLRFIKEDQKVTGGTTWSRATSQESAILSPEATFLITNTLTQITRPDLPNNFDNTYRLPRIAWKTGTSYGKKDAWSIGYNKKYTVGVWVGNFSGEGVPELSGADIATPLLFNIFNTIAYNSPTGWFKPAPNLTVRKVCAESGQIPSEFCTHAVADYAIMGISSTLRCQHLKPIFVNVQGTVSYCTQCLPDSGYVKKMVPNLAPELMAYYENARVPYQKIPPHSLACTRVLEAGAPVVVSPNDGSEYYLNATEPQPLQLACQAQNDVEQVYWYINDKLFQKASPQTPLFFEPARGKTKISCSDDKGRNTDIWITIK
ncbi:MAG: penicillin-binding protein 1C [Cytophagia bacterium]|nr:MAG: penicillin-binding protein 1C [Cytophagales bacterium]TAG42344.1 MAG: penicillin-binding protein 1C [Cytophagia bacterium]TAG57046.1 MAG: penicillin-binding protein 1C [Runella slithyformis]TAG84233.1 MAG: penicillin-binding protein 1C [Cytophagales bacterium]